jgi:AcrR family transcriptional regulator
VKAEPTPRTPRKRRTQEERSTETRTKILDATLACLIERGYAGTSTPEVCRRAELSRGALLHHFPTREELVISAVAHLAARRALEIRARAKKLAGRKDGLEAVLELMWSSYDGPLFHAALELWVAARSDRALHAALVPVERSMGKGMRAMWADLLEISLGPDVKRQHKLNDVVLMTQHMLRGMAMQRILKHDDQNRRRLFELWKRMAREALSI